MITNTLISLLYKRRVMDNFVFQLFYRWTVLILVVFSFIVTCRLLVGDSFTCAGISDVPQSLLESDCYAGGVYSLPGKVDSEYPTAPTAPDTSSYRRYQSFYPWVNLFFLIQAFNFYLPHLLWKIYDSGYIRRLTSDLDSFFSKEENRSLELCYLAKYVLVTQGKHKLYALLYIFLEVCNYAISLAQTLWLVNFFVVTGVPDFLQLRLETWADFRQFYFPSSSDCEYGSGGVTRKYVHETVTCSLPLNHLYMKMFLFLHAWYVFVTILSGLVLLYRIALLSPSLRVTVISFTGTLADKETLKSLCSRLSYSDWFFLTRLQKAMTDVDFAQMLDKISVVSHCKSLVGRKYDDNGSYIVDEIQKECDSSDATSPV